MIEACGIGVVEGVRYRKERSEKERKTRFVEAKGREIEKEGERGRRELVVRDFFNNYIDWAYFRTS